MSLSIVRICLLSNAITMSIAVSYSYADETGIGLFDWAIAVKKNVDDPLTANINAGVRGVKNVGQAVKHVGPVLAGGATLVNGISMASDFNKAAEYGEKRRAGTETKEEAKEAGKLLGSFTGKTGLAGSGDMEAPLSEIGSRGAVESHLTTKQLTCQPQPECLVGFGDEKNAERFATANRQKQEWSSRSMLDPAIPKVIKNGETLVNASIDSGTTIGEFVGPTVDSATSSVASGASAIGNWLKDNSAAAFDSAKNAVGFGGAQDAPPVAPAPQAVTAPVQPQAKTQLPPPPVPATAPTAAPAAPVVMSKGTTQVVAPRQQQATVTPRQAPTTAVAQPQQQAATVQPPPPKADSPWQQQQRADAAAAAAIAAEQPAGLSQGQPAIGGIQSDKIWYDGSEGFGGLYELDPKEKAQQAIGYTEANYPDAVSVDGHPFGVEPKPDPFGDLVPDAADAIEPEQPVQNRDVPPEPVEQAASEDENFDAMSSSTDPYTAPQRQPRSTNYGNQPPRRRGGCDGSPQYDTRNPVSCY